MTPRVIMKSNKLGGPAKKVLCYLMTLWTNTDDIHPSMATIADITDQSESGVKRGIKELATNHMITIIQRGNGSGHSNSYAVNVPSINKFFGCEILMDPEGGKIPEDRTANGQKGESENNQVVPDDYFTRQNKLPDVLLFKDASWGKHVMKNLIEKYGKENIPKHFCDDIKTLEEEAKKYPYSYDSYKMFNN